MESDRTVLEVPYRDKDEAKELGAWWDPKLKKWYVPKGKDVAAFERWLPQHDFAEGRAEENREALG